MDKDQLDRIERSLKAGSDHICNLYTDLLLHSIKIPTRENRLALLIHTHNCNNQSCKFLTEIMNSVTGRDLNAFFNLSIESHEKKTLERLK